MVAIAPQGAYFSNPRILPRYLSTSTRLICSNQGGGGLTAAVAGFWTNIGIVGTAVDSNWTGGVKKQLVTSTSAALIYGIVGPCSAAGDTDTYEIIIDGITYTLPAITSANLLRTYLGSLGNLLPFDGTVTTSYTNSSLTSTSATSGVQAVQTATNMYIPSPEFQDMFGTPKIWAQRSFTISCTHSASLTTTVNQERQAGVIWRPVP